MNKNGSRIARKLTYFIKSSPKNKIINSEFALRSFFVPQEIYIIM